MLVELIARGAIGHVAEVGGTLGVFHPTGDRRGLLASGKIDQGLPAGSPGSEGGGACGGTWGAAAQGSAATRIKETGAE